MYQVRRQEEQTSLKKNVNFPLLPNSPWVLNLIFPLYSQGKSYIVYYKSYVWEEYLSLQILKKASSIELMLDYMN